MAPYKRKNGTYEHICIAEKALGKCLPKKAVVHHVDGNTKNNRASNLVICQNQKYHYYLHKRENATKACGNKHWRPCVYCKQYDDEINMKFRSNGNHVHLKCETEAKNENRRIRRSK